MADGGDGPATGDLLFWRLLAALFGVAFAALAAVLAFPAIDLAATAAFHAPGEGFPLARTGAAITLRSAYHGVFYVTAAAAVVGLLGRLLAREGATTPAAVWAYVAALCVAAPGLMANALFKAHWGRARPMTVEAFGGSSPYTPPFVFSDACAENCSFVSGEVAMAAATVAAALGVFGWMLRAPWARIGAGLLAAAYVGGNAALRMAAGKHFLSDALFAALLTALVAMGLYAALGVGRARAGVTPAAAARDVALALRRAAGAAARLIGRSSSSAG